MKGIAAKSINLGVFIFPSTVLTFNALKDVSLSLIILGALSVVGISWRQWKIVTPEIKVVVLAFCLFAAWALFSTFYVGEYAAEGKPRVSKYFSFSYVLFIIPAYFYIRGIDDRSIAYGFALGSLVVFAYGVYQHYTPGDFGGRAYGDTHPNRYGGISMAMAMASLSYAVFYKTNKYIKTTLFLAAVLGVFASFYSGTRGAWIAFPPCVLLIGFLHARKQKYWKKAWFGVILVLLLVAGGGALFGVHKQVARTYNSAVKYMDGNTSTSLGLRLEMFRSAMHLSKENPVVGVGVGRYHSQLKELVDSQPSGVKSFNPAIKNFHNPHNEYLLALAERGGIGFLLFILVLICPASAFFVQYMRVRSAASVAGLSVVLCYSIVGLSIGLFEHSAFMQFYLMAVVALLCSRGSANARLLDPVGQ